jgi:hypothetical protein
MREVNTHIDFIELGHSGGDTVLLREIRSGNFSHREREPRIVAVFH